MNNSSKIRVIKKEEAPAFKIKKRKRVKPRETARDMVSTVSDWVADFKDRKSAEAKAAIDLFRPADPRPSES
jgi:hypothetical protein